MLRKPLLLSVVFHYRSGAFDGDVKPIQAFEKIIAAERVGGEGVDDGFDFAGDDVSVDEVRVVKDGSEQSHGQEVLDEHLFNCGFGEVRVDCLTAFLIEIGKGNRKLWVRLPCFFAMIFAKPCPNFWHNGL